MHIYCFGAHFYVQAQLCVKTHPQLFQPKWSIWSYLREFGLQRRRAFKRFAAFRARVCLREEAVLIV